MSDERSPTKETVKFPPPPDWAIALAEKFEEARKEAHAAAETLQNDVTALKDRVSRIADDQVAIVTRVATIEGWREGASSRLDQGSLRAKADSVTNESQNTRLDSFENALAENTADTKAVKEALTEQKSGTMIVYEDLKKSPTAQRAVMMISLALLALVLSAIGLGKVALDNLSTEIKQQPAHQ